MLILLDYSTPAPLRYALKGRVVVETVERGWERFANGALLDAAEEAGFELFVTADKNTRYQQNLTSRKISIVVLGNAQWPSCGDMLKEPLLRGARPLRAATPKCTSHPGSRGSTSLGTVILVTSRRKIPELKSLFS